jgi:hypothetical protein
MTICIYYDHIYGIGPFEMVILMRYIEIALGIWQNCEMELSCSRHYSQCFVFHKVLINRWPHWGTVSNNGWRAYWLGGADTVLHIHNSVPNALWINDGSCNRRSRNKKSINICVSRLRTVRMRQHLRMGAWHGISFIHMTLICYLCNQNDIKRACVTWLW